MGGRDLGDETPGATLCSCPVELAAFCVDFPSKVVLGGCTAGGGADGKAGGCDDTVDSDSNLDCCVCCVCAGLTRAFDDLSSCSESRSKPELSKGRGGGLLMIQSKN